MCKAGFAASKNSVADFKFLDLPLKRKLQIRAIYLGTVGTYGTPVATQCTTADYLMHFLHWRAVFLKSLMARAEETDARNVEKDAFCRTLWMNQIPPDRNEGYQWMRITYKVFASLLSRILPMIRLDAELELFADQEGADNYLKAFLQKHFKYMIGQSVCLIDEGPPVGSYMGLGTGALTAGDQVVTPYGCLPPIILRPDRWSETFRFAGDVYVHAVMHGEAMDIQGRDRDMS